MREIVDGVGRTWKLAVSIGGVKRVRELLGADMLEMIDDRDEAKRLAAVKRFTGDLVFAVDVIYVLLKPQAEKLDVSQEDFAETMFGEPMEKAFRAFVEEVVDFFRSPALRAALTAALARLEQAARAGQPGAEKLVRRIESGEFDEMLGIRGLGKSSGGQQESSGSPEPTSTVSAGESSS